jgi:hypothetical protein
MPFSPTTPFIIDMVIVFQEKISLKDIWISIIGEAGKQVEK